MKDEGTGEWGTVNLVNQVLPGGGVKLKYAYYNKLRAVWVHDLPLKGDFEVTAVVRDVAAAWRTPRGADEPLFGLFFGVSSRENVRPTGLYYPYGQRCTLQLVRHGGVIRGFVNGAEQQVPDPGSKDRLTFLVLGWDELYVEQLSLWVAGEPGTP